MEPHHLKELENFKVTVGKWQKAFKWAALSYVAIKNAEGLHLLFGRINLDVVKAKYMPCNFETEHILAGLELIQIAQEEYNKIITGLQENQISLQDRTLKLYKDQNSSLSAYFATENHPYVSGAPRAITFIIRGSGKQHLVGNVRQLDWELKAADKPFSDLEELLAFCGLPSYTQINDSTIEVVVRAPVVISNKSKIIGNIGQIECLAGTNVDKEKIKVGYRLFQNDQTIRGKIDGIEFEWKDNENEDVLIGNYSLPIENINIFQAFISYDGIAMHEWWITDPEKHLNQHYAVNCVFEKDFETLHEFLSERDNKKAKFFEEMISALFNVLGFSVVNIGKIPRLQEGPDIIATAPSGNILVAECTVGILDENDKLAKVFQKTELIKQSLKSSGFGHLQVQPAIVTPLSRDSISVDFKKAGEHGIAVICKENLLEFLTQTNLPPNADKLFEIIRRMIPGNTESVLFTT